MHKQTGTPTTFFLSKIEYVMDEINRQNANQILRNNHALAKRASEMMSKISSLEQRVRLLERENFELRTERLAECRDRKNWFEDKLLLIESCVMRKFDEIGLMFKDLRAAEGLPPMMDLNKKLVHFGSEESHYRALSSGSGVSVRKRKSLRRQSIYVSEPDQDMFPPPIQANPPSQNITEQKTNGDQSPEIDLAKSFDEMSSVSVIHVGEPISIHAIPEPSPTRPSGYTEHSISDESSVKSENAIFDKSEVLVSENSSELEQNPQVSEATNFDALLTPQKGKLKLLRIKSPRKHNQKEEGSQANHKTQHLNTKIELKSATELPVSGTKRDSTSMSPDNTDGSIIGTSRRTRRKSVNYALPSLKVKMRRPISETEGRKKRKSITKRRALRLLPTSSNQPKVKTEK